MPKTITKKIAKNPIKAKAGKNVFAGVGFSSNDDAFKAGQEAARTAIDKMTKDGGKKATFGLVFCSGKKYGKDDKTAQQLVDGIQSVFKDTPWAGCTTAGEISSYGATNGSCVAMAVSSDYIHAGIGFGENVTKSPKEAGFNAARMAMQKLQYDKYIDPYIQYTRMKKYTPEEVSKMNPFSILILGKGVERGALPIKPSMTDNEKILEGVEDAVKTQIPIIGGVAADDFVMRKNYHFLNGKLLKNATIVIAFMSHLYSSAGMSHGYKPTEKILLVNDAKDYIISKMNGKSAVDAYSESINVPVDDLRKKTLDVSVNFPLGVADPSGDYWLRVPGIVIFNNILVGAKVSPNTVLHVMKGGKQDILNACKDAVANSMNIIGKRKPSFVIVFSCAMRAKLLGKDIRNEVEILKKSLGDVPIIGFYTFGEFGGFKGKGMGYHNETVTAMVFSNEIMA